MNIDTLNRIREMAGATKVASAPTQDIAVSLIDDLIKGAAANKNLVGIQLDGVLAQAGFTPYNLAKTAGMLAAFDEAGLSVKEACEATGLNEETLQAITVVTR